MPVRLARECPAGAHGEVEEALADGCVVVGQLLRAVARLDLEGSAAPD
jgi:hypothetical protein